MTLRQLAQCQHRTRLDRVGQTHPHMQNLPSVLQHALLPCLDVGGHIRLGDRTHRQYLKPAFRHLVQVQLDQRQCENVEHLNFPGREPEIWIQPALLVQLEVPEIRVG